MSQSYTRILVARWYEELGRAFRGDHEFVTMNYGLADGKEMSLELQAFEEPSRLPLNLYARLAEYADLRGNTVLEVGSGRGGGARFLARSFEPASYLGVDRSFEAIALAQSLPGLPSCVRFVHGDAERLPSEASAYHVLLNVESAHAYGSAAAFALECARVLRPDGCVVLADFGNPTEIQSLRSAFEEAGFVWRKEADITSGVLLSIEQRKQIIEELVHRAPESIRERLASFAASEGTRLWHQLQAREVTYFIWHLVRA